MYSFKNDYSEGAHERIVKALVTSNMEQTTGYGEDQYCDEARKIIKDKIRRNDVDIHFLVGGTQTNLTALSAFLKPYEAAIAPETGHILVHETGAIEATGHKAISVPSGNGKITSEDVKKVVELHTDEHMVKPRLVYISNPTEIGTLYTKEEVLSLRKVCDEFGLYLYMDGARLASAITSPSNDMTFEDIASNMDAFYIGGTKCGAAFGEALVICNENLKQDFRFSIKQKGAMLAKGRFLGIQFKELLKDDLYVNLGHHSNKMAYKLRDGMKKAGYKFFVETDTNQIFPIISNEKLKEIGNKFEYTFWQKYDENNTVIRLVTSWATDEKMVDEFLKII